MGPAPLSFDRSRTISVSPSAVLPSPDRGLRTISWADEKCGHFHRSPRYLR